LHIPIPNLIGICYREIRGGGMNKSFSVGEAFKYAWKAFKENALVLILLTLLVILVQFLFAIPTCGDEAEALDGVSDVQNNWSLRCSWLGILHYIVNVFTSLGYTTVAIISARGGKVTFGQFFSKFNKFFHFFVAWILYSLIVIAGLILLIFPGIIWGIKYSLYPFMVVDKGAFGWTALQLSAQATYGAKWDLLGLYFIVFLLLLAGFITFGLGLFITLPLTWIAQAYAYQKLTEIGGKND
jgi:uncharacterized membrane protein